MVEGSAAGTFSKGQIRGPGLGHDTEGNERRALTGGIG